MEEEEEVSTSEPVLLICGFVIGFLAAEFVLDIKEILLSRL